jgi:hypothetical protein
VEAAAVAAAARWPNVVVDVASLTLSALLLGSRISSVRALGIETDDDYKQVAV